MWSKKCVLENCQEVVENENKACCYEHYRNNNLTKKCTYCDNFRINFDDKVLESCGDQECVMKYLRGLVARDFSATKIIRNHQTKIQLLEKRCGLYTNSNKTLERQIKYLKQDKEKYKTDISDLKDDIYYTKKRKNKTISQLENEKYELKEKYRKTRRRY